MKTMSDDALVLRPWEDGDDLKLLEVLGDPENPQQHQDRTLLRPSSQRPWSRCVVAEESGVPVGAAVVSASALHPRRLWFYAETAPGQRRRGIATQMLVGLREEIDAEGQVAQLKARYSDPAEHTAAFLAARGFAPIQRSRQVVIGPGAMQLPELTEDGLTVEELATGSVELTKVVAQFYTEQHQWDPAQMSIGKAAQLLLGDQTGASGAVVLRDKPKSQGGKILAFAISYTAERSEDATDVLLGHNPELTHAQAQFSLAGLLGMLTAQYSVRLEIDDSMEALTPIVEGLLRTGHAEVDLVTHILATDAPQP